MELLILLAFLTGWFVCWTQMSKSESRQLQELQSLNQELLKKFESPVEQTQLRYLTELQLENQKLKLKYQELQSKMALVLESQQE